jgi:hypothetical protein
MTTGHGLPTSSLPPAMSGSRHDSFIAPIRHRIDERLILAGVGARGSGATTIVTATASAPVTLPASSAGIRPSRGTRESPD